MWQGIVILQAEELGRISVHHESISQLMPPTLIESEIQKEKQLYPTRSNLQEMQNPLSRVVASVILLLGEFEQHLVPVNGQLRSLHQEKAFAPGICLHGDQLLAPRITRDI